MSSTEFAHKAVRVKQYLEHFRKTCFLTFKVPITAADDIFQKKKKKKKNIFQRKQADGSHEMLIYFL